MNNYVVKYFPDDPASTTRYWLTVTADVPGFVGLETPATRFSAVDAEAMSQRYPEPPGMSKGGWSAVAQPASITVRAPERVDIAKLDANGLKKLATAVATVLCAGLYVDAEYLDVRCRRIHARVEPLYANGYRLVYVMDGETRVQNIDDVNEAARVFLEFVAEAL